MVVKIAARQSDLARLQAFEVGRALQAVEPKKIKLEFHFRSSLGDQRADDPLWKMPEKGVFTEDFVADIMSGKVDLVVHSWKDLPILDRTGTQIAATLPRADARDVLLVRRDRWVQRTGPNLRPLPFRVLTSSPRRVYNLEPFLKWALPWPEQPPEIEFVPVRGNIATRVSKLTALAIDDSCDAIVVAKAALDRLLSSAIYGDPFIESAGSLRAALQKLHFVVLPLSVNPAAAAQGALAIEVRSDRQDLIELCSRIDASHDRSCVEAERRELARHGGGCHQKIGVTILRRDYGTIEFIRGLTDAGDVLNSCELRATRSVWPKPRSPDEVYAGVAGGARREISHAAVATVSLKDPTSARGLFIARAEAWPKKTEAWPGKAMNPGQSPDTYVWTAGLSTWKKLAGQGVWVHGSSEGLGEGEETRLETLAGNKIEWLRLTHEDAPVTGRAGAALATYRVDGEVPDQEVLTRARFFYWKSGTQFQNALAVCSSIANGYHATGPGATSAAVRYGLRACGVSETELEKRLAVFLSEADFHKFLHSI